MKPASLYEELFTDAGDLRLYCPLCMETTDHSPEWWQHHLATPRHKAYCRKLMDALQQHLCALTSQQA